MRCSSMAALLTVLGLHQVAAATPTQSGLSVTIYSNNQALIEDTRTLQLQGGRERVEFKNVSAEIRPETVSLSGSGLAVVEQNFDYDLLSPAKMMEKAVGHVVTIVRTNPATGIETREQAEVLSVNGGVILKIGDHIEVLRDDGIPTRVVFDKVPDNLRASPTLSITVDAAAGSRPASLSYLTPGLGWKADYVALYDEAAGKIDVQGWVTLTNTSGATYDDADTLLVAGTPALVDAPRRFSPRSLGAVRDVGVESGDRERLGDFYLYPLKERTTIADKQTKQVSFLDVRGAPAGHSYSYRVAGLQGNDQPESAQTIYSFSTKASGGLGDQLPAGVVRFYLRDRKGAPQFIGESPIEHTPMGSELELATGDAFDVKVRTVVQQRDAAGSRRWKTSMSYTLSNASPTPASVNLVQDGLAGDSHILSESQSSQRPSAEETVWRVLVPANGRVEVTATFDSPR